MNKENEQLQSQDHDMDHEHHAGCSHDHSNTGTIERSTGSKIFKLNKIIQDLRDKLPINAEAPNEQVTIPKSEEVRVFESWQY